jgi:hypothetical protein
MVTCEEEEEEEEEENEPEIRGCRHEQMD